MAKNIKYILALLLACSGTGCANYLDVVPDKTQEVSLLFERKESAYRALATCYHYLPFFDNSYGILGSSDELIRCCINICHFSSPFLIRKQIPSAQAGFYFL